MMADVYPMGFVVAAGHGGVGATDLRLRLCSGLNPSTARRPSRRQVAEPVARLSPSWHAAMPELALVVDAVAGTPARASSPRKGHRPGPLDGAAR